MDITEIIKPIKLLNGSHENTGATGQGCFMNVIAYLNGEPKITDQSACVCVTVRPIAIWLNDFMDDKERHQLIPYIERAMGSATRNSAELSRRVWRAVKMADEMCELAASSAAAMAESAVWAAESAACAASSAAWAAASAAWAAESAACAASSAACAASSAAWAAASAACAASSAAWAAACAASSAAWAANRKKIIASALSFLDDALPKTCTHQTVGIERAKRLVSLQKGGA